MPAGVGLDGAKYRNFGIYQAFRRRPAIFDFERKGPMIEDDPSLEALELSSFLLTVAR